VDANPAKRVSLLVLALLAAATGCGRLRAPEHSPRDAIPQPHSSAPRSEQARPQATRPAPAACDPRAGDPDRGRVGLGLLAGDCEDDRGGNGVYVTRLVTVRGLPSPAQRAGIRVGDRLVRLDACEVPSTHELARQLRSAPPGWVARVVVERGGREVEAFVATIKLPDRSAPPGPPQLSTAGCRAIGRPPAR
jgi:S1-C subfamily serine protease